MYQMKIVIVDENPKALIHIESELSKWNHVQIVKSFLEANQAKAYILENNIDAVIMCVDKIGLGLTEIINRKKPEVIVTLVSNDDKYALDAFELDVIDFLLKPVEEERVAKMICRMEKHIKRRRYVNYDTLNLQVCNRFEFIIDNKYKTIAWQSAKAKELFLYLLHHNGTTKSKETVLKNIWPNERKSVSTLNQTIDNIRLALQDFPRYFKLTQDEKGYRMDLHNVQIDLYEWEQAISILPETNNHSINDYERVMRRNAGAYLQGYDYAWAESKRIESEAWWTCVALEIAKYYYDEKIYGLAHRWYATICERNPEEEQAVIALMEIYDIQGKENLIRKFYQQVTHNLQELFNAEPSDHVTKWYEEWEVRQEYIS